MDLKRKLEIFDSALESITTHTDADSVVVLAALNKAEQLVTNAKQSTLERASAEAEQALSD